MSGSLYSVKSTSLRCQSAATALFTRTWLTVEPSVASPVFSLGSEGWAVCLT
jgi:hypothetical protein